MADAFKWLLGFFLRLNPKRLWGREFSAVKVWTLTLKVSAQYSSARRSRRVKAPGW